VERELKMDAVIHITVSDLQELIALATLRNGTYLIFPTTEGDWVRIYPELDPEAEYGSSS
jgi:hypothetical protein